MTLPAHNSTGHATFWQERPALQRWIWRTWLFFALAASFVTRTYHAGVFPLPAQEARQQSPHDRALWIQRDPFGVHQLVLEGSPFGRGKLAGERTAHLLQRQETELVAQFEGIIPSTALRQLFILSSIVWFTGAPRYFEPWATAEMYGVSLSAPHGFDYLADGFTRQIAYHGLHEVGQLMVDRGFEDMGCTVIGLPVEGNWIVGRNFDFEGGRTFDEEKILKWVFPDNGHAFVSVIWAGMVGGVTGVNDQGLYLSLNAAGSDDFRRVGTPSTLVLIKALQFANNVQEALRIIEDATVFITDIYVLADAQSGSFYRIEKSPQKTIVIEHREPVAIANHLVAAAWGNDTVNNFRKNELTSRFRQERGQQLVDALAAEFKAAADAPSHDGAVDGVLAILRDKGLNSDGQPLHLGNRRAIDALIATHSVLYDAHEHILYVGQGPSVAGAFTGFDLNASFAQHHPVASNRVLASDPLVTPARFAAVRGARKAAYQAIHEAGRRDCNEAERWLRQVPSEANDLASVAQAQGDVFACRGQTGEAQAAWREALRRVPAYPSEEAKLQEKLAQTEHRP